MNNNAIEQFINAVKEPEYETNTTYSAVVSRVDSEGVVWVNLAGSEKETPTASTAADVKAGDVVTVQWRNNKLYIAGNYSDPSAGVIRVANVEAAANTAREAANNAVADAGRARNAAEQAEATAQSVEDIAQRAENAATNAIKGLAQVEDVVATLNWIATHCEYEKTTDVTIVTGKAYYTVTATQVASPTDADIVTYYELVSGEYVKTTDTSVVSGKAYYTVEGEPVVNPVVADIGTYYELDVTEAVSNYINTHVAVTDEGLWLIPDDTQGSNKVLIATGGAGHTYEDAGTYIIDENDYAVASFRVDGQTFNNSLGFPVLEIGKTVSETAGKTNWIEYDNSAPFTFELPWTCNSINMVFYYDSNYDRITGLTISYTFKDNAVVFDSAACTTMQTNNVAYILVWYSATGEFPYFTFGSSGIGSIGRYSVREGDDTVASGSCSHAEGSETKAIGGAAHAEGDETIASGSESHAEGYNTTASGGQSHAEGTGSVASNADTHAEGYHTTASGIASHAEGWYSVASRASSHAQNYKTIAASQHQTALGKYNTEDNADTYSVIIGNGTSDNARSNALTVDWLGNVDIASGAHYKINGANLSAADVSAVPTMGGTITKVASSPVANAFVVNDGANDIFTVDWDGNVDAAGSIISDANYEDAWHDSTQGYTVSGVSLAGSTYLGQAIRLEKVSATKKHPIFNGFDISGTGTARIHTLGHYIYKATYNGEQYWYAYIKMRNDNTSAINNFDVTAYIAWI